MTISNDPVLLQDPAALDTDQVLASNERTLVVRRRLDDGCCVVVKRAFGADAQARLRHEAALLERLRGVPGLVQMAPQQAADGLTLCDQGGQTLAHWLTEHELDVPEMIDIALRLAQVVAQMHRLGVVHKDINPSNVLITQPGHQPVLIDFNIATCFAQEQMSFSHERHIEGTLAYMPPEQTGRTGRMVDQRSDLYALGATLYEMVMGRRPFESDDILEVLHDHLVREPLPPAALKPHIPEAFSDILMRLLAKDADCRYQSAEGLARDLQRLKAQLQSDHPMSFPLGQDDFPPRLSPPSRLIGRHPEVAQLREALDKAVRGQGRALLIAGAPGVGKSALINEMQPMVSAQRGWFVSGKFEQYQRDSASATVQALRALGRLLLAEPEAELQPLRERILHHVGANAGLGATLLPEFVTLLGELPQVETDNPQEAEKRMIQASVDLLRSVISAERPLVMVIDDLQWAPAVSLRFIDALMTHEQSLPGLLMVGAYRSAEVDALHPMTALIKRWAELGVAPPLMQLDNLPAQDICTLIGDMLRMPVEQAQGLSLVLLERTHGNPYDTVELVNALRHEGLLQRHEGQWHWDEAAIRRHVSDCDVVGLLNRRIQALPLETGALLDTMACLGGEASMALLQVASALDPQALDARMAPALEDGLVVCQQGHEREFKYRHDRVQQAVHERLQGQALGLMHLSLARRLRQHGAWTGLAAQQYLKCVSHLNDPQECREVIGHFQAAAAMARVVNYELCERFLSAALQLMARVAPSTPPGADQALWLRLRSDLHGALYGLGRLEEADTVYAAITASEPDAEALVDPACVQIASLSSRSRHKDAMAIGLQLLQSLGLSQPEDLKTAIGMALMHMSVWIAGNDKAQDLTRPEMSEPRQLALAKVLSKTQVAAFFCAAKVGSWLTMASHRLWVEHGPCPALMATLCSTPMQLIAIIEDHQGAFTLSRHLLKVGEARGYEPATSVVRFIDAMCCGHWFEPLENSVPVFRRAREGLLQAGDLQYGIFTYAVWTNLFDSAPRLSHCEDEIMAALSACARYGDTNFLQLHRPSVQLYKKLSGQMPLPTTGDHDGNTGTLSDEGFDEAAHLSTLASPSIGAAYFHAHRALASAFFEDQAALHHHSAQAMLSLSRMPGNFLVSRIHALRGLSLAMQLQAQEPSTPELQAPLLNELDKSIQWLKRRAKDAPSNFLHLQHWLEAERAWALGEHWQAFTGFNTALGEAAQASRPWQCALITERAAHFHLGQGMALTGQPLLQRAHDLYEQWGAKGKVAHMQQRWPALESRHAEDTQRSLNPKTAGERRTSSTIVSRDMVDVLSVLRASQALSSETSLAALTQRVSKVLGAMTGAESVLLAVRESETAAWQVLLPGRRATANTKDDTQLQTIALEQAAKEQRLALSPFRYAERTREPLLINEPIKDERFNRDPCILAQPDCALLILPVLNKGALRAMLMLENRQSKGAFSSEGLDAVTLIAGQLSVSLDNAMLYASLEEKVAERTAALEAANRQLELLSATDGLTGVANRRRFDEALQTEWLRARRAGSPIGLVLIDIDHFKLYNDHHGHQGGDTCLKKVASTLASGLRAGSDLAARYGGEEFVLLLANTDLAGTRVVAERVRAAVQALGEPHGASSMGVVTISVGITSFVPQQGQRAQYHIERADQALYEAKRSGRNRVCGPV